MVGLTQEIVERELSWGGFGELCFAYTEFEMIVELWRVDVLHAPKNAAQEQVPPLLFNRDSCFKSIRHPYI